MLAYVDVLVTYVDVVGCVCVCRCMRIRVGGCMCVLILVGVCMGVLVYWSVALPYVPACICVCCLRVDVRVCVLMRMHAC